MIGKLLISFFFTLLIIFTCLGQYETYNYGFTFKLNNDGITYGYEVYFWVGADTTVATRTSKVGFWRHDTLQAYVDGNQLPPDSIVVNPVDSTVNIKNVYLTPENGEYLVAWVRAQSYQGAWSDWNQSPAFQKPTISVAAMIPRNFGITH